MHQSFLFKTPDSEVIIYPQAFWLNTELPTNLVDEAVKLLIANESSLIKSQTGNNQNARNSQQIWLTDSHWIAGVVSHYASIANRHFGYDLTGIHQHALQYTVYNAGGFFHWHEDEPPKPTLPEVRKLAFSLQLSSEEEYTGGELQIYHCGNTFFAPKQKGSITFFDARCLHRVRKIKSGIRRALVGWIGGPPWK